MSCVCSCVFCSTTTQYLLYIEQISRKNDWKTRPNRKKKEWMRCEPAWKIHYTVSSIRMKYIIFRIIFNYWPSPIFLFFLYSVDGCAASISLMCTQRIPDDLTTSFVSNTERKQFVFKLKCCMLCVELRWNSLFAPYVTIPPFKDTQLSISNAHIHRMNAEHKISI